MKSEEIGILEARITPVFSIEEVEKILECEKKLLETKPIHRETYISKVNTIDNIKKQFKLAFEGKCKKL
jgi:hypothetical protein|nr:MAG TPA: hypothetical protein [Caudoviricetes sp.]